MRRMLGLIALTVIIGWLISVFAPSLVSAQQPPGDLQSVFQAMLENAVSICNARVGNIYRREEDNFILVASYNLTAFAGYRSHSVSSTGTSPADLFGTARLRA